MSKSSRSKGPLFKPHQRGRLCLNTPYSLKARLLDMIWFRKKRPLDTIHPNLNWHLNCNNNSNKSLSQMKAHLGFPGGSDGKESAGNAEDLGSIPGSGRSSGEGNDYTLQCAHSCLENSMNRGAWWATVHGVVKSWTDWVTNTHTHKTQRFIYTIQHIQTDLTDSLQ